MNRQLVDLLTLRIRNGLTQQQVADFLGTTKGYISIVEKGKSKLSDENISKIATESEWDTRGFVPNFDRICDAWMLFNNKNGVNKLSPLEDKDPFGLGSSLIYGLFLGVFPIDNEIANKVLLILPELSIEWLLNGEGVMISAQENPSLLVRIDELEKRVASLEKALKRAQKSK